MKTWYFFGTIDRSGVTGIPGEVRRARSWRALWGYYLWGTGRGMLGIVPCKDHRICERAFSCMDDTRGGLILWEDVRD